MGKWLVWELFIYQSPVTDNPWIIKLLLRPRCSPPDKPRRELGKAYVAADVEQGWYEWWENQGYFRPRPAKGDGDKVHAELIREMVTRYKLN